MTRLHKGKGRLLTLLVVLTGGCDLPGKPREADRPVPADQVKNFNALYSTRCAGCHGADGKLGPAPPLNDPLFLAIVPDAELLRVITEGRAVTPAQKSPAVMSSANMYVLPEATAAVAPALPPEVSVAPAQTM